MYLHGDGMSTVNIRIDADLKSRSFAALEKLGVSPSEFIRQALEYVAEQQRLPFKPVLLSEDEEQLLAVVRERLANPQQSIKVNLNDL